MKVTWRIVDGKSDRNAKTHWAPGVTAERLGAGGFPLACSRNAPTKAEAQVIESLASINCSTCLRQYQREQQRGRR